MVPVVVWCRACLSLLFLVWALSVFELFGFGCFGFDRVWFWAYMVLVVLGWRVWCW